MKLIYIVGMGRSGSTLLDILLDAHSRIHSLGGVRRLVHYAGKHPCACGAPSFQECPFWSEMDQELQQRIGRTLTSIDVHQRNRQMFQEQNRAVFEAAASVANVDFVTDNSKSVQRLRRLMFQTDIEVIPVHVLRDPRGRAQSVRKRKQQNYIPTLTYSHRSLRLFTLLYNQAHIVVQYERLASNPQRELTSLMQRLGLEFEPQQLSWAEQPHHNIGAADVLRKTKGSAIKTDNAWQELLPSHVQRIVHCLAWPGRIANQVKARRWGL